MLVCWFECHSCACVERGLGFLSSAAAEVGGARDDALPPYPHHDPAPQADELNIPPEEEPVKEEPSARAGPAKEVSSKAETLVQVGCGWRKEGRYAS